MPIIATITSKKQLTIPVEIFRKAGLKEGQKVLISEDNGAIKIETALSLVEQLAGSVKIPEKYKKISIDQIIRRAKEEYFKRI